MASTQKVDCACGTFTVKSIGYYPLVWESASFKFARSGKSFKPQPSKMFDVYCAEHHFAKEETVQECSGVWFPQDPSNPLRAFVHCVELSKEEYMKR